MNTLTNLKKLLLSFIFLCSLASISFGVELWHLVGGRGLNTNDYIIQLENASTANIPLPGGEEPLSPGEKLVLEVDQIEIQKWVNDLDKNSMLQPETINFVATDNRNHPSFLTYKYKFHGAGNRESKEVIVQVELCFTNKCDIILPEFYNKKGYLSIKFSPTPTTATKSTFVPNNKEKADL